MSLALAILASACNSAPFQTAPTALAASDGGRFSTLAEIDREPLGSPAANCANDRPIMTQANPRGGTITFEFRIGHGTSKAELWIFKRRNERGQPTTYALAHKFDVGDGVETFKASYDTNEITEAGHYYVIVRRLKCGAAVAIGEFSELKEFTLGTPDAGAGSSTCEDEWAKVPGADPVGRCKAIRELGL
jgi:hypothetical protein